MKRSPRKVSSPKKAVPPSPAEIRSHLADLVQCYQNEWQYCVLGSEPRWVRALCLHLQLTELEGMESAMQEFFP